MSAAKLDVHPGRSKRYPAGPSFLPRLVSGRMFRQTAVESMTESARRYGDLVHYTVFGRHIYQLNHPELVEDLLLKDAGKHHRGIVMQRAKTVLGEGLLTSEEPLHMRQRRLAQPAFLRQRIAAYGEVIGQNAAGISESWKPGAVRDVHEDMLELALRIVGKCLFDLDVQSHEEVKKVSTAVDAFMGFLPLAILPFSEQIQRLPLPAMRRIRKGQADLDAIIYGMIRERRRLPGDRGDLLSMLLEAVDVEDSSGRMSDQQVHDECLTIMLAGHETTANALSFALWLIAKHPDVQTRLWQEACTILGDRAPTADDYARLTYATQVFSETMRLYPPVWVIARTCVDPYEIAGYPIAKGTVLIAPQFVVHRDPRFYPDPLRFDPERFAVDKKEGARSRPRFAFFPFAAGSRQCIGEGLAWMEGVLSLATIVRDWRLSLPEGSATEIVLNPAISLRPKYGVPLLVERRS
ncbi:cytochrome P450 [Tunturiibacter empetritectus]|uniref:Cytochrome P450 n=1 Tax=Tunturiibacter lichenicola TaxID=2051959 RepID=A0A852VDN0_9BACT|nr:cytochrome P450 [Edaphobacter lichenicola]NYF89371.1 cytochrome P450 [Edaphobacter lichenicola]